MTTADSISQSPNSININVNDYTGPTSKVLKALPGGKGNVLIVRGVESVPVDQDYAAADKALLAHCPNVKVVGTVVGDFNVPAAKTAVQEFLASASRQDRRCNSRGHGSRRHQRVPAGWPAGAASAAHLRRSGRTWLLGRQC